MFRHFRDSISTPQLYVLAVIVGMIANTASAQSIEGTYWRALELSGKPTPTQDAKREAHLVFQGGGRLTGSDGCNRFTGSYELENGGVTFGSMAGTQMACIDAAADVERAFRESLKRATRLTIAAGRLELFDAAGNRVAVFAASAQAPDAPTLARTSWQLVKFQGGDGTIRIPDDGAKYTIEFGAAGQLTARVDCNRGRGTWKSSGPNQVQLARWY